MTKRYDTDMARIAAAGWGNTIRYGLLWMISSPANKLTQWTTTITLTIGYLAYYL
ncbi:hypothetical protein [Mycobacteroides chelonae]|uniref:hypothetical protein n=1 Tax=Mycobacteroides chelonae TaxID=1774 RepID=UPI0013F4D3F2|nr:hypothetical protein [Mycobacteroides chelonae]